MNEKKSLNESIISIRVKLQNCNIKKSGKNDYAGFDYFELADFLPKLNELMLEEGINDNFQIDDTMAKLTLIKREEKQVYTMPFVLFGTPLNRKGQPSMQDIQYLGALNTYYKRYLYINAFGITDGEIIDKMDSSNLTNQDNNVSVSDQEPKSLDYKTMLEEYIKNNNLNKVEVCKQYGLTGRSTNANFRTAYIKLVEEGAEKDAGSVEAS